MNDRPHKKMDLWREAVELVTHIYETTKIFPKEEEFGLKSQLRRAAVSVPSNIAEGLARKTNVDKIHFLNISNGSLSEIDTQLEIALRLKYIDTVGYELLENKIVVSAKIIKRPHPEIKTINF